MTAVEFWDDVHSNNKMQNLGANPYKDHIAYLSLAGDINKHISNSSSIMDIGPGACMFLNGLPIGVKRYAIDISDVHVQKLNKMFDGAYNINVEFQQKADVLTCISVIQHCTDEQVQRIIDVVSGCMHKTSVFYANCIVDKLPIYDDDFRLKAGRFSHTLSSFTSFANKRGLSVVQKYEYTVSDMFDAWIAQFMLEKFDNHN